MMDSFYEIFQRNKDWAARMLKERPDFFENLAGGQHPEYLWIGCSDSRVPANQIIDLPPGDVFVHRNVANIVVPSDLNCLSVLQYAIEVLKVKHVIVCGHYGCGGIEAALSGKKFGMIDNWLRHIRSIIRVYETAIDKVETEQDRLDLLCELNVIEQVRNVCATTVAQDAWDAGQDFSVHGIIYSVRNGLLKDLIHVKRDGQVEQGPDYPNIG
ncbi:MAG: carbonate dehydratase [Proteobacteria bacterium]|nr:carbonate dehydratase [Pseudomonadota bacterium]